MSMFDYAREGLKIHARSAGRVGHVGPIPPNGQQPMNRNAPGAPTVGWTTPSTTYDKMRQVDAAAKELDALVQVNVKRPEFKAAWDAWLAGWRKFFDESMTTMSKLGSLFHSDELAQQAERYRAQLFDLGGWREGYSRERDAQGNPLPSPVTPPVPAPPPPAPSGDSKKEEEGFTIPWWGWMLGGVAVVGVGYYLYRRYTATRDMLAAREHALTHQVLPVVLGSQTGPAGVELAHAAAAGRDPGPYPHVPPGYLPPMYRGPY